MAPLTTSIEINPEKINLVQARINSKAVLLTACEEASFEIPGGLVPSLKKLSEKYNICKSQLVTFIPRHQVFLKKITIPPGSPREIKSMLRFEAEKHLPFPAEDAVIDFFSVLQDKAGSLPLSETSNNIIFLAAVKKSTVETLLAVFAAAGLMPDEISISTFAVNNLVASLKLPGKEPFAVFKPGKEYFEFDIFLNNTLLMSRGLQFSNGMLSKEIENTITIFSSENSGLKIDRVLSLNYLAGFDIEKPGSELKLETFNSTVLKEIEGLSIAPEILPEELNKCLLPVGLIIEPLIYRQSSKHEPSLEQTPALTRRPAEPHKPNFLPEEIKDGIIKKRKNKAYSAFAAIAAGVAVIFSLVYGLTVYRNASSERQMAKMIEQHKPELQNLKKINDTLALITRFKGKNPGALAVLKEISAGLPSGIYIRNFQYDLSQNTVTLDARAGSYAASSKAITELSKLKCFSQVSNKGAHAVKIGETGLVDFEVTCVMNDTESLN
ncbi:MAG: pilus assembly protein PilM [Elusimicrobia bacterium]|nr:pilus assembly protein PilM [Candidatus Liberimonas magnetica]